MALTSNRAGSCDTDFPSHGMRCFSWDIAPSQDTSCSLQPLPRCSLVSLVTVQLWFTQNSE